MDVGALATIAIAALTPYLVKGGEELAKSATKDLWELIKKPFMKNREKELLKKFEESPTDEGIKGAVVFKLVEFMEENPSLANDLEKILQKFTLTVQKKNVLTMVGDQNIQIVGNGNITTVTNPVVNHKNTLND